MTPEARAADDRLSRPPGPASASRCSTTTGISELLRSRRGSPSSGRPTTRPTLERRLPDLAGAGSTRGRQPARVAWRAGRAIRRSPRPSRRPARSTSSTCSVEPDLCVAHAREAVAVGARCLWLQLGIATGRRRIAHEAGLAVVMDRCRRGAPPPGSRLRPRVPAYWPIPRAASTGGPRATGGPVTQIHLHAEPGDYAPVVLLPGDPNRATRIAARFDGGLDAPPAGQRRPRPARLHRHGRWGPGVGPDHDDGHADHDDRDGGAAQPRRDDVHPGRHERRLRADRIGDVVVALAAAANPASARAGRRRADRPDRHLDVVARARASQRGRWD